MLMFKFLNIKLHYLDKLISGYKNISNMIHRSQFGIGQNDSLVKTFFGNDWTHCILERRSRENQFTETPNNYKRLAKWLLSS